jgi:hypothetical protein
MPSARSCRLVALLASVLGILAFASSASAALTSTPFGCRASVLCVTLLNNITAEPYVANTPTTPCANSSSAVEQASVPSTKNSDITAGPAGAFTLNAFDPTGKTAPGAAAVASVEGVTIPTASGNVYIAGPIQATAQYQCINDKLVQSYQSTLDLLYIGGVKQVVPNSRPTTFQLGGGNYIAVNQETQTANSLTIDLVHVHLNGIADIVVGEAKVTQDFANPCANTTGAPPVVEICPPGSTLDPGIQYCVIRIGGKIIIVSRPFRGPSGGTVYALSVARKRFHSPCDYGPGPKYVLVAKKVGGRVEGTEYSDRILAYGAYERVAGLGGNDCINGKALHQQLYDGNGKERVYAFAFGRVAIGSGNSMVEGGAGGHDDISLGNGNTKITGRGGHNRIDAGLGKVRINAGPGPNRVFTPSTRALVNCGTGGHNTAYLRDKAIPYAKAHGCNRIVHLV